MVEPKSTESASYSFLARGYRVSQWVLLEGLGAINCTAIQSTLQYRVLCIEFIATMVANAREEKSRLCRVRSYTAWQMHDAERAK
jgi:hypothetical protein